MSEELILSPSEEEMVHAHFKGLLPGQIEYPLGPLDERLPFPIYFRLLLNQRQIIKTHLEIGWCHQGIEKLLEQASLEEGCEIIRRVNPLCSNIIEHSFRIAAGLEPLSADLLKTEKQAYHLHFIQEILKLLREDHFLRLSQSNFEHFKKRFLASKRLQKRLSRIGVIHLKDALSYGLTGPTLRACQQAAGDIWSRLSIKLEEISNPSIDTHPEGDLIISCLPTRVRIRTPAFMHAAALPVFFKQAELDDLVLIMLSLGLVGTEIDR